jgi:hypothetical protein
MTTTDLAAGLAARAAGTFPCWLPWLGIISAVAAHFRKDRL